MTTPLTARTGGTPTLDLTIGPLAEPNAVPCCTNAEAVAQVMLALGMQRRPALVGGGQQIRAMAQAVIELKAGKGTSHSELFMFRTWAELQDYVGILSAAQHFVDLIGTYGPHRILAAA